MRQCSRLLLTLAVVLGAREAGANPIGFETFTPLANSVIGGTLSESTPFLLSSVRFSQQTISANNSGALNGGVKLGDNWDQITLNENGPSAGRYLFSPYETGTSGVRRLDLLTGEGVTIVPNGTQGFANGDASRWTPFGTYLTAEESTNGRLFEVTNPLDSPASINFVWRSIIPVVAQEGLSFDKSNNMYFVDENAGGAVYKYTSVTPNNGSTFFNAGQSFVLKVGAGNNTEAVGAATWVPITNVNGVPLPGIPTVVVGGLTVVDGRAAADAVQGTTFNRPEDLEIQTLPNGDQILYVAPTTNHRVFSVNLSNPNAPVVRLFADQNTTNAATGTSLGSNFLNPDNLAIDANGNIYIVEDIGDIASGGTGFDVWFAFDADRDGVAESLGRWASLSTVGSEPTGLYFNPFNQNVAYINVQHTGSDVDRTIQITAVPEPASCTLLVLGLAGAVARRRASRCRVPE